MLIAFLPIAGLLGGFALGWFACLSYRKYKRSLEEKKWIINGHQVVKPSDGGYICRACGSEQTSKYSFEASQACPNWADDVDPADIPDAYNRRVVSDHE